MENLLKQIKELQAKLSEIWQMLNIEESKKRVAELREEISQPDFWNDRERAVEASREAESEEKEIAKWEEMRKEISDLSDILEMAMAENDESMSAEIEKKYGELEKKMGELEFYVLFAEKYDKSNAIISIHAGAGGIDAQDWAEMLERMFLRFAEKKNWRAEMIDRTIGNEAGIKNAMYRITGKWAYGHLKSESGVHRLVRISPFDAEAMRHTSFSLVEVIPELPEADSIEISANDIRIDVFRSSGPGGQSVNTTDSAVRIVHKPTNITVTCQTERSQHQNKETAMKVLKAKLFKLQEEEREAEERKLKGEAQKAEWGRQIRSYVLQPYQMVKDHRTDFETADISSVLEGGLDGFIEEYLRLQKRDSTGTR